MKVKKSGGSGSDNYTKPKGTTPVTAVKPPTKPGVPVLTLPDEISTPITTLGEAVVLIHGEPKIGKTSLAAMFPDALFLMFEPGGKGLRIYMRELATWAEFKGYVDLLYQQPGRFRTVVVDIVDLAYDRCSVAVCKQQGVDHPSEGDYGAVWQAVEQEFGRVMNRLIASGRGVIFISHTDVREFQSRSGEKYNKLVPSMKKQARTYMTGVADLIGYYGYYGRTRYLTVQGSDAIDAGHRLKERFRTKSGEPVHSVPMGDSNEEAYANLVAAFNNEQAEVEEPAGKAGLSDQSVKRQKK